MSMAVLTTNFILIWYICNQHKKHSHLHLPISVLQPFPHRPAGTRHLLWSWTGGHCMPYKNYLHRPVYISGEEETRQTDWKLASYSRCTASIILISFVNLYVGNKVTARKVTSTEGCWWADQTAGQAPAFWQCFLGYVSFDVNWQKGYRGWKAVQFNIQPVAVNVSLDRFFSSSLLCCSSWENILLQSL